MKLKTVFLVGLLGAVTLPCAAIEQDSIERIEAVELKAQSLDELRITDYQTKIGNELEWNGNIRFMAKGAGCVAGVAACLMFFNDFSIVQGEELRFLRQDYSRLASFVKTIAETDQFKDNKVIQDIQANGGNVQATGGWGSFFGRLAGQMAFSTFFSYVSQKIISGVFFEQSVKWYVQERTLLADLDKQLQDLKPDINTLKLGRAVVSQADCDHYIATVLLMHNEIAEQLEQIVAYMSYKVSKFPQTKVGLLSAGSTTYMYLKNRVQSVADKLNASLGAYKDAVKKDERILIIGDMFDNVQLLMTQITSNVSQFALVEKKMQKA